MIILILGEIGHADLIKAIAEAHDIVMIEGSAKPESFEEPFMIKSIDAVYELEHELIKPSYSRHCNRAVKLPPAPVKRKHFKPSKGRL